MQVSFTFRMGILLTQLEHDCKNLYPLRCYSILLCSLMPVCLYGAASFSVGAYWAAYYMSVDLLGFLRFN